LRTAHTAGAHGLQRLCDLPDIFYAAYPAANFS